MEGVEVKVVHVGGCMGFMSKGTTRYVYNLQGGGFRWYELGRYTEGVAGSKNTIRVVKYDIWRSVSL